MQRDRTRAVSDNGWGVGPGVSGGRPHVVLTTYSGLVDEDVDARFDVYHRKVW
jgi:hypothetical protein